MATPLSLIRRLTLSILMPFILLLTQHGALMHELSHWHPVTTAASPEPEVRALDVDHDICLTCLSFAQVGGLAKFEALAAPEADGLKYHFASEPVRSVAESSLPVARSRGPPLSV